MTVLCEQAAIFQSVRACPLSPHPTPPPILPGHSDDLKPVTLVLSPRPRTLVRRKQKCRCTLLLPEEQSTPPPHLRNRARATHTAEKLQFVRITSV